MSRTKTARRELNEHAPRNYAEQQLARSTDPSAIPTHSEKDENRRRWGEGSGRENNTGFSFPPPLMSGFVETKKITYPQYLPSHSFPSLILKFLPLRRQLSFMPTDSS